MNPIRFGIAVKLGWLDAVLAGRSDKGRSEMARRLRASTVLGIPEFHSAASSPFRESSSRQLFDQYLNAEQKRLMARTTSRFAVSVVILPLCLSL
jgi:hypothetical protein